MKGLIYKEFFIMKALYKSWAFGFVFIGIYAVVLKNAGMIFILPMLFGINGLLASFTYDHTYQWDASVLGMPVKRSQIVCSKYLFILLLDLGMLLTSMILLMVSTLLGAFVNWETSFQENLISGGAMMIVLLFYQALETPIIYKLGVEKARIVCVLLALTPLLCLVVPWAKLPGTITEVMVLRAEMFLLPLAAAAMGLSAWLSIRLYEKNEY